MHERDPSEAGRRDHGGDLDAAIARWGGARTDWLDLSTGVNPRPYPVGALAPDAWARLPDRDALARLIATARAAYGVAPEAALTAAPGASALIRLAPRLAPAGRVAIVSPTYNEHAAAFADEGWRVTDVAEPEDGVGAEALVVVNPNNPDGRRFAPERLAALAERFRLVIVDESFVDAEPALSLAGRAGAERFVILRSFGKFYGLAGLRLGAAIGGPRTIAALTRALGPWAVSGPALAIGAAALADRAWAEATRARLEADAARLDALGARLGWRPVGGTPLFRTFEVGDARALEDRLGRARIRGRVFPYAPGWLRLAPPAEAADFARLAAALEQGPTEPAA